MSLEAFPGHFRTHFGDLRGHTVLVALSGGGDSVALTQLLADPSLGLRLAVAHVHHGLRGAEADHDAAFCHRLAEELELPFHLLHLPAAPPGRGSLEAWWRKERYRRLLALGRELGAAAVATGHNRDDVAEGVLVQLLRGAGPRAMAGIHMRSAEGLIRPLLPWTRHQIRQWLRARGLPWREDSSNQDPQHLRNAVRREVLPALEALAPAIRRHLERLAQDLALAEAAFSAELHRLGAWIDPYAPGAGVALDVLAGLHPAQQTRWLHAQASRAGIGAVTRRQCELFLRLLAHGTPASVTLAGRWRLRRAGGKLWLEPPTTTAAYRLSLEPGAASDLPLPGWRIRATERPTGPPSPWSSPPLPARGLHARPPRPGDRFLERRVVDWLREQPRHLRVAWPVVCCGDTIVWVPGIEATALSRGTVAVEVEHP